jgi:hypothetical protein
LPFISSTLGRIGLSIVTSEKKARNRAKLRVLGIGVHSAR